MRPRIWHPASLDQGHINKTKCWFFEKINKMDKPLGILRKINKIRNEKEDLTNDKTKIHEITRDYLNNYTLKNWTI